MLRGKNLSKSYLISNENEMKQAFSMVVFRVAGVSQASIVKFVGVNPSKLLGGL